MHAARIARVAARPSLHAAAHKADARAACDIRRYEEIWADMGRYREI